MRDRLRRSEDRGDLGSDSIVTDLVSGLESRLLERLRTIEPARVRRVGERVALVRCHGAGSEANFRTAGSTGVAMVVGAKPPSTHKERASGARPPPTASAELTTVKLRA